MLSLIKLKKHSTSSVLLALGCSSGRFLLAHSRLCHSLPSMFVITATKVSLENPKMLLRLLDNADIYIYLKLLYHTNLRTYLFTSSRPKSYVSLCQGIRSLLISFEGTDSYTCSAASWISLVHHWLFASSRQL